MKLAWREHVNFSMTLAWNLIGGLEYQDIILPWAKSLDIFVSRQYPYGLQLWLKAQLFIFLGANITKMRNYQIKQVICVFQKFYSYVNCKSDWMLV